MYRIWQPLDHFNDNGQQDEQWNQRMLISTKHFDKTDPKVPIFFYSGNEGDIEWFYRTHGFITETLAKEFKAAVIFGEHRFFGESYPGQSFEGSKSKDFYKYLTIEQAEYDYVSMIKYLKNPSNDDRHKQDFLDLDVKNRPIIAIGGAYGGMLAAWLRMKYPSTFAGALASSAPLLFTPKSVSPYAYNQAVTTTFASYSPKCSNFIQRNQMYLNENGADSLAQRIIQEEYETCEPINTKEQVVEIAELV